LLFYVLRLYIYKHCVTGTPLKSPVHVELFLRQARKKLNRLDILTAPQKQNMAQQLVEKSLTGEGCISFQVIQEFLNLALRKFSPHMSTSNAICKMCFFLYGSHRKYRTYIFNRHHNRLWIKSISFNLCYIEVNIEFFISIPSNSNIT